MGFLDNLKKKIEDAVNEIKSSAKPAEKQSTSPIHSNTDEMTPEELFNAAMKCIGFKESEFGEYVRDVTVPASKVDTTKAYDYAVKAYNKGLIKALWIMGTADTDNSRGLNSLKEGVAKGDTRCMYALSTLTLNGGMSLRPDLARAKKYAQMAADAGNPFAYSLFAEICFREGDIDTGKEYLEAGLDAGSAHAYYLMGLYSFVGEIYPQDLQKAEEYFKKAIDLGGVSAYMSLAMMYQESNPAKMKKLIKQGVELGDPSSAWVYASILAEQRDEKCIDYYTQALNGGVCDAIMKMQDPTLPLKVFSVQCEKGAPDSNVGFSKPVKLEVKSQGKEPNWNEIWEAYVVKYRCVPPSSFKDARKRIIQIG